MKRNYFEDNYILNLILKDTQIGWWIKDTKERQLILSDIAKETIGAKDNTINFTEFVALVREDYRDRITREVGREDMPHVFNQIFPILTAKGSTWIHAKALEEKKEKDSVITLGYVQPIEDPEEVSPEKASLLRTNNLLYQLSSVSRIMLSFLETDDPNEVINNMLKDILKQFKAGRAYIFEYDWEKKTQTNTYEVVDDNIQPEIDVLKNLPLDMNAWWTQQIKDRQVIVLSTLDDLPPEAQPEREVLEFQDINSLFVAPLLSKNGAWGYAGIDIVDGFHTWTNEDYEWIVSVINIIGLCIQLQRSEKEALLDKTYLQNLYKNMPLGYIRLSVHCDEYDNAFDFTITDANHAADELFHRPLSKMIGTKASDTPVDFQEALIYLNIALQNNGNYEGEYHITRSDRYTQYVIYSIQKGELIALFSDISESHRVKEKLIEAKEKAEVSDKLKSAFLANMSHEIRTPLNAIVGFSDLLVETEDTEERKVYSKLVNENNELLLQLISDILDISKIEAGTLDVVQGIINVNQLCLEIIHAYHIKHKEGQVRVTFDEFLPSCFVYGDKNRITQIINNFINNALKFTKEGSISLGYKLTGKDKILFYVKDTGCGIALEDQSQIFERFVKLNNFVTGTGLGLPICKSLAEQMGGEIGVESKPGEGSCFWFTHPYKSELQSTETDTTRDKLIQKKNDMEEMDHLPLILVAEDTDSNFLLLSSVLKGKYELIRAKDGIEALDLFEQRSPDLILMDIKMPRMDGIETTRKIREINADIPIIAVTAFAYDSDIERVLAAGCNTYLSKPIKAVELIKRINEIIDQKKYPATPGKVST